MAGAIVAAVGFFGVTMSAASTSTSLSVTATVNNNCTISTAALAFGAYDPVVTNASSPLDGTGTVTIACTKGATTTIGLGLGTNASGSTRRMTDGSGNYLTYEAYQESSHSTVWVSNAFTCSQPGTSQSSVPGFVLAALSSTP